MVAVEREKQMKRSYVLKAVLTVVLLEGNEEKRGTKDGIYFLSERVVVIAKNIERRVYRYRLGSMA